MLGIEKPDTSYVGAPRGGTRLEVNDRVLLYGKASVLKNLDERRSGAAGNWEHHKAVDEQQRSEQEQVTQI